MQWIEITFISDSVAGVRVTEKLSMPVKSPNVRQHDRGGGLSYDHLSIFGEVLACIRALC